MPACGIPSELRANQMAPAGAISGHGNDYAPLGNGVLFFLGPGLALSFPVLVFRSSTSRFEVCVLQKLSLLSCPALFPGIRCRCVVLPPLGGTTGCAELTREDSRDTCATKVQGARPEKL